MALRWVKPGEVSGLAIVMYCRSEGASNAEVLAACRDKKTNRAKTLHLKRKLDFMKARTVDGTLRYYVGPAGSRPGPVDAEPFVVPSLNHDQLSEAETPDGGPEIMTPFPPQSSAASTAASSETAEPAPSDDYLEPETEDERIDKQDDRPVVSQISDWTISVLREKWDKGSLSVLMEALRNNGLGFRTL